MLSEGISLKMFSIFKQELGKLDELLTHEVQLEDINKAFEFLKEPKCVKVLIKI